MADLLREPAILLKVKIMLTAFFLTVLVSCAVYSVYETCITESKCASRERDFKELLAAIEANETTKVASIIAKYKHDERFVVTSRKRNPWSDYT